MAISPSFHRYRILSSFFLTLDIKLGCTILTLFNLFNKSAGIFGLLAIFQGGTLAQLTLYAYSLGTIFISLWGLRGISEESAPTVMMYAHCYLLDHLVSSLWSVYFFTEVFYKTEHNGQPPPLSPYQSGLMSLIEGIEEQYVDVVKSGSVHHAPLTGQARVEAAQQVWKGESTFSASVIGAGWVLKIYFALLLYSYALHLRHGTYRSLPMSKSAHHTTAEIRNGYVPIRPSISIETPANNGAGAGATTLEEEVLPAWSDDEDDEREHAVTPGKSSRTRATLDRLAS